VPCEKGQGGSPLIPDIKGLTRAVTAELSSSKDHKEAFSGLMKVLKEDDFRDPTIEDILSRIRSLRDAAGKHEARGLSAESLDELDAEVCQAISSIVTRDLPDEETPYHSLARLVTRYQSPPSEIFTTNYDLLMEQALESRRAERVNDFETPTAGI
jgi:hypothetical protein